MLCPQISHIAHSLTSFKLCANVTSSERPTLINLSKTASLAILCIFTFLFVPHYSYFWHCYMYLFICLLSYLSFSTITYTMLGQGSCHAPQQLKQFVLHHECLINICWMREINEWWDKISLHNPRGDVQRQLHPEKRVSNGKFGSPAFYRTLIHISG